MSIENAKILSPNKRLQDICMPFAAINWLTSPLITELPNSTLEITGTAVCQQIIQAQRQTYVEA